MTRLALIIVVFSLNACNSDKSRYKVCQGVWTITRLELFSADTTYDMINQGYYGKYIFDSTCDGENGSCPGSRIITEPDSLGGSVYLAEEFTYSFHDDGETIQFDVEIPGFWTNTEVANVKELTKDRLVFKFEDSDGVLYVALEK